MCSCKYLENASKTVFLLPLLLGFALLALSPQAARAQFTVEGQVTDAATGKSLPGVNVFEEASGRGTSTDADGHYRLELPGDDATLSFSFVGYLTKDVEVSAGSGPVNVALSKDVAELSEVVVSGMATSVERANLANAVATVNAADLAGTTDPQTLSGALQGKVPGVSITSQSGAPGGGFNVQLRGISTLGAGSSQPLYIIDGVYVNNSSISTGRSSIDGAGGGSQDNTASRLADLNPDEIASVEILKGPSAAAIYGARANAGVVIITTKKGVEGPTQVNFSQDLGFNTALNLLGRPAWTPQKIERVFSDPDRAALEKQRLAEARANGNMRHYEEELYGNTGMISNTKLSLSGGSGDTQFYVSGNLKREEGIIKNTGFNRRSLRANLDHDLTDRIHVASRSNYLNTSSERGFTGNQNGTGASLGYSLAYTPSYAQLYPNEEGSYPGNPYFADNPLAIAEHAVNEQQVNRFLQSLALEANLYTADNLSLELSLDGGLDYLTSQSLVFLPRFLQHQRSRSNPGDLIRGQESNLNTNLQGFLVLNSQVGDFNLTTQAGVTRFSEQQNRQLTRGQGLAPGQTNVEQAQVQSVFDQQIVEVTDLGLVGQQEMNWSDKVIATLGARFDKSTLNAAQNDFYFFPKASLAVNVANFDFWSIAPVSQLKLRAAYGETGGLPNFGETFEVLNGVNIGGGLGSTISTRGVDPNLRPETAQELEVGADLSLLDDRVAITATYYNKTIDDVILDLQPAGATGISAIATNAGALRNRGVEFELGVAPLQWENFSWYSTILYWQNDSEIMELDIPAFTQGGFGPSLGTYYFAEGYSPSTIVGTPATPDADAPFTVYGNAQPDFQMSFSNDFTLFENFNLSFLVSWSHGGDNINLSTFLTDLGGTTFDWNGDNDGDGVPNGQDRAEGAGAFVQDASYVKLREAGLYYNVPQSFLGDLFGEAPRNLRVGVSGANLLLFSDYPSYDPEVSVLGTQPVQQGVEITPYPSSRRVIFTVQLGL